MSIIGSSYCLLLLIVWILGIIRYKRLTAPFKILTWSVFFVLLFNIASSFFSNRYRTNAPILQIECITEYIFYSLVFYHIFNNKTIKKVILLLMAVIIVCFFINAIFIQPFSKKFPTNLYVPTQILYTIFSLLLFKEMLLYPTKINIIRQSVFWYNTAMLFYATTMFLNLGLTNIYAEHNHWDNYIYYFWYGIVGIFHILVGISILTDDKGIRSTYG